MQNLAKMYTPFYIYTLEDLKLHIFINFSMLKLRLQKLDGLTHAELKENITKTIRNIPKEKYKNIIKCAYERPEKYVSKKSNTRKIKKNYL